MRVELRFTLTPPLAIADTCFPSFSALRCSRKAEIEQLADCFRARAIICPSPIVDPIPYFRWHARRHFRVRSGGGSTTTSLFYVYGY